MRWARPLLGAGWPGPLCPFGVWPAAKPGGPYSRPVSLEDITALGRQLSWGTLRGEPATIQFDWSFAPMPTFDDRFARQNRFGPPPGFPLASPYAGIVHWISGRSARTRPKASRATTRARPERTVAGRKLRPCRASRARNRLALPPQIGFPIGRGHFLP